MGQGPEYSAAIKLAAIGLGGNEISRFGPPENTLKAVFPMLARETVTLRAISRFYRTPAFPPGSGNDFINAVAILETKLSAHELLLIMQEVEAACGRQRKGRWGSRTMDLDLLMMGDSVLPDLQTYRDWATLAPEMQQKEAPGQLILPHPRLQDRAFVLIPFADVAPLWVHPVTGLTIQQMAAALPPADIAAIQVPRA